MAEVKWIKIVVDIFDDEKIRIIEKMPEGDAMIVIWFKLLCVAGKSNSNGFLMLTEELAYTEDMLASLFGRDPRLVSLAIKTFERMGMIEVVDNVLLLTNWVKHQNAEKLATIREQTKMRTREYRERLKLGDANSVTAASPMRHPSQENKNKTKNKSKNLEREEEREGRRSNPARARADDHDTDSLTAYISSNLYNLTPGNWEQLREIMEDGMSAEMVKLAVDAANAQNARTVAYVMSVLNKWLTAGYRTPDDVKAAEAKRQAKNELPKRQPPRRAEGFEYE